MFSEDFYPTPRHVGLQMIEGLDLHGKVVLEPEAGAGALVSLLKEFGAKVLACENHPDLAKIACTKADQFLCNDFLKLEAEQISHIDYIIMNPPFTRAGDHLQHAWDIAPAGCHIISLSNVQMLKNAYSKQREILNEIIKLNGSWRSIGNAFSTADRQTDCEIALIHIFKPGSGENEFDGYFFDMVDEQEDGGTEPGIMRHNEVREIVNRYVGAVKMFDSVVSASGEINRLMGPISSGLGIAFGAYHTSRDNQFNTITRDVFKKQLQKSAWKTVFDKMNMRKYVTSGVMSDINKFVEQQQAVPFTMANIYKLIEIVIGTNASRMDRVLIEAFDHICNLSADNSEAGEKWKTNSNYKVNRRFIDTYVCEWDSRWPTDKVKIRCGHRDESLDDIMKALCFLMGKDYDEVMRPEYLTKYDNARNTLSTYFNYNNIPWGMWVKWNDFFMVRGYKKGAMHFEFVDENVWMEFNRRVAKIKGWSIPQKTNRKKKGTERTRSGGVEIFESVNNS